MANNGGSERFIAILKQQLLQSHI